MFPVNSLVQNNALQTSIYLNQLLLANNQLLRFNLMGIYGLLQPEVRASLQNYNNHANAMRDTVQTVNSNPLSYSPLSGSAALEDQTSPGKQTKKTRRMNHDGKTFVRNGRMFETEEHFEILENKYICRVCRKLLSSFEIAKRHLLNTHEKKRNNELPENELAGKTVDFDTNPVELEIDVVGYDEAGNGEPAPENQLIEPNGLQKVEVNERPGKNDI